jgi:hypothetical protein
VIERDLARSALADKSVARLMTIPGIDMVVALALAAAIGDVQRFEAPQKLVSYLELNPSVRQSGPGPAYHGRITKQGRWACPWHAGRGRLGRGASPWSFTGVLPPGEQPARPKCGGGCNGPQAGRPHIASIAQRRELPVGPPGAACQEDARARTQGRAPGRPRPERSAQRLQSQEPS